MEKLITRDHLRAAKQAGACRARLSRYQPGSSLFDVARQDLEWVESHLPGLASEAAEEMSRNEGLIRGCLRLSDFGYGSGSGSGDGYGYGYGYGDGSGDGSGCGDALEADCKSA